jgi:hypothetical protein
VQKVTTILIKPNLTDQKRMANKFSDTNMKNVFRILEPFCTHFASQFAKSANRSITIFVVVNIQYGYTKMLKLMLILNLLQT